MESGSCKTCMGGFHKEHGLCVACRNIPGFVDQGGSTCDAYVEAGVCVEGVIDETKFHTHFAQMSLEDYRRDGAQNLASKEDELKIKFKKLRKKIKICMSQKHLKLEPCSFFMLCSTELSPKDACCACGGGWFSENGWL